MCLTRWDGLSRGPKPARRDCMCPVVLTRGADQMPMSTKFDMRGDEGVVRNYGRMLVELAAAIPDGIVCFFVSYSYMDAIVSRWNDMGILKVLPCLQDTDVCFRLEFKVRQKPGEWNIDAKAFESCLRWCRVPTSSTCLKCRLLSSLLETRLYNFVGVHSRR